MNWRALVPILCVSTASLIWGAAYTANKISLDYGSPAQTLWIQLAGSVAFLSVLCAFRRGSAAELRAALGIWWTGLLEPGLTYFLGITGLQHSDPGIASMIISSEAILVMIIMAALGWEVLTRSFVVLSIVSFCGICLIILGAQSSVGHFDPYGGLLLFLATLSAASYAAASDRLMGQRSPLAVVTIQQAAALGFVSVVWVLGHRSGQSGPLAGIHVPAVMLLAASGIAQYGVAFLLFLFALKHLAASLTSVYLNLIPIFGVAVAIVVLGESFSMLQAVGCAMAVGSLFMLSYSKVVGRAPMEGPVRGYES
jgi:drug/metabolite transporter (DMT)-like permease